MTLQSVKDELYFNQKGNRSMIDILEQIADAIGIKGVLFVIGLGFLLTVIMVF